MTTTRLPRLVALTCLALGLALLAAAAWAADPALSGPREPKKIEIAAGKSLIVNSAKAVKRLTLADPERADILLLSPHQVYLTGKAPGTTTLTLWGGGEELLAVYDVLVALDVTPLKEMLHQVLPNEPELKVMAANDQITLSGTVSSASSVSTALSLAKAFVPSKEGADAKERREKVVNLLSVGGVHQVMLEVRVAELSRDLARRMNINFASFFDGAYSFLGGQAVWNVLDALVYFDEQGRFQYNANKLGGVVSVKSGNYNFSLFIDALKENGVIKVLAEPNLICLSGETAEFLAGGEIPIPVPQGLGTVAIEYKPFGVGLSFTPRVVGNDRISMDVFPEVSELDYTNAVTISSFVIPALTTRRAKTTVELSSGQSFAIAGLIKNNMRESVKKYPVIGDIPILGALFRSSEYQKNESELVIIVTPTLVKPLNVAKQTMPTDGFKEPSDFEFYMLGRTDGAPKPLPAQASAAPVMPVSQESLGFDGEFGHTLPTAP